MSMYESEDLRTVLLSSEYHPKRWAMEKRRHKKLILLEEEVIRVFCPINVQFCTVPLYDNINSTVKNLPTHF
jgi:hypothetical protein